MAEFQLMRVEMAQSGEPIEFAQAALIENEMDGNVYYDLIMKNVPRYELFYDNLQEKEPVQVRFTTYDGRTGQAVMNVRTVNKQDPSDNIVELGTSRPIDFS